MASVGLAPGFFSERNRGRGFAAGSAVPENRAGLQPRVNGDWTAVQEGESESDSGPTTARLPAAQRSFSPALGHSATAPPRLDFHNRLTAEVDFGNL